MSYEKTILCLANSRKTTGRCIAGKEATASGYGAWIRPISGRPTHEISEEERRFDNGKKTKVLDVVRIPLLTPQPTSYQVENHLIDHEKCWTRERVATWDDLQAAIDPIRGPLWINGHRTYHGLNDKIPAHLTGGLSSSLMLLGLQKLGVAVSTDSGFQGQPDRRRVGTAFEYSGHHYSLIVTDPRVEEEYLAKANGRYPIAEAIVCVSLSELIHAHAHKLAAAMFTEERCNTARE